MNRTALMVLVCSAGCTFHAVATPASSGQPVSSPPPSSTREVRVAPPAAPAPPSPPAPNAWIATPPQRTAPDPIPAPAAPDRSNQRDDRKRDRKFDKHSDWDKLGERSVDGRADRDSLVVGRNRGAYAALSLVVEQAPVEIFDIVVLFEDGTTFSPNLRAVFGAGVGSHVFDLPGAARFIRQVTFRYGNLAPNTRAQLELWGLDARRDSQDGHDGGHRGRGRQGR